MKLRWGILGASKIAKDFILALRTLSGNEHEVIAVASSSTTRAQDFARDNDVKTAYGSYEDLVNDPEVQVVYISTYNTLHSEHCKLALSHGKAVLCEKPLTMNLKETKEVLEFAKEKKLFIMEAMWTRFLPSYQYILEKLEENNIGDVQVVQANFGLKMDTSPRIYDPKLGGSVILDIGIYVLTLADMIFDGERPEEIQATGFLFDTGVDHTSSITMKFKDKRIAQLFCTAGTRTVNKAMICGSEGQFIIEEPFHCPTKLIGPDGIKEFPLPETKEPTNFINSSGLRYEIAAVRDSLMKCELENKLMDHETTMRIMEYMDEIRVQLDAKLQ